MLSRKFINLAEKIIFVAIIIGLLAFVIFNFTDLNHHIFQMADDYLFPDATRTFLKYGEYHWAGAKPGIVLLAALFRLTTPGSIMFLFMLFGFIASIGLFLLCKSLFESVWLSAIAPLLWVTSSFFFYYARTEHLISVACYLFGLWLCFDGFKRSIWWRYYLGCVLLGYSVLCHYVILFYLPVIFAFFAYLFYKSGYSFLYFCFKTVIPFLAPIILLDTFAFGAYVLLEKKNWPFLYSLWGQHKILSKCVGGWNSGAFFCLPKLSWQVEWKVVVILIGASVACLLIKVLREIFSKIKEKDLFIFIIFSPTIFLILRFYLGHITSLRAFGAVIPVFYLLIIFLIVNLLPVKSYKYLFYLVFLFCGARVYSDHMEFKRIYKSGYYEAASYLNQSDFNVIVYYGQKKLWEQLVKDKEVIPLNVENDALAILKDEKRKTVFFNLIQEKIYEGKKVCFVGSGFGLKTLRLLKNEFSKDFDCILRKRVENPVIKIFLEGMNRESPTEATCGVSYIQVYEMRHKNNL